MIDITQEELISITQAASIIPRRRAGRKCHIATIYRWIQRGVKGVRLEAIQVGGTRCTSSEALQRFFNALSNFPAPYTAPIPSQRKRMLEEVDRELDKWFNPKPRAPRRHAVVQKGGGNNSGPVTHATPPGLGR
jgi:hypothetical protein